MRQIQRVASTNRPGTPNFRDLITKDEKEKTMLTGKTNTEENSVTVVGTRVARRIHEHLQQIGDAKKMRKTMSAFFGRLAASLIVLCCGAVPSRAEVLQLTQSLDTGYGVERFLLSPDGRRIVYVSNKDRQRGGEVYSVPLLGGVVSQLSPSLDQTHRNFIDPIISPNSKYVLYQDLQLANNTVVDDLYSVRIQGGLSTQLNEPRLNGASGVAGFSADALISPDNRWVVYLADQDTPGVLELYYAPLTGGPATKLNAPLISTQTRVSFFQISSDSRWVVYTTSDFTNPSHAGLYSVPITGGPVTRLNAANEGVDSYFAITPDGRRVVFVTKPEREIASVPVRGGAVTKLSGPAASSVIFVRFAISPDSHWVVYSPYDLATASALYSVRLTGGPVAKLTPPFVGLQGHWNIWQFAISPDS